MDVASVLNEDSANARAGGGGRRLHRGLPVTEVALATRLLFGAGLLICTSADLTRVDPGFHNTRILIAPRLLENAELDAPGIEAVFRNLRRRVDALPGVVSSGLAQSLPLLGSNWTSVFTIADQPVPARADLPTSAFNPADAGYFDTMGIPLLEGRYLSDTDQRESPSVIVVTETLARRLWPTDNALGKRLKQGCPKAKGTASPGVRSLASLGVSVRMASMKNPDPKRSSPSGKRPPALWR